MLPVRKNYDSEWLPSIFNDFFDNDWMGKANATAPAINVLEDKHAYTVEVAAPGMKKENFNIKLSDDNLLVISMENKHEEKEDKDRKYLRREFSYSKFEQSLILPEDVDKEKISAAVENGVLSVTLPKMSPKEMEKAARVIDIL